MLSPEQLLEIEARARDLYLESLPQIVNVDVPALLEEVRALQSLVFVGDLFSQGGGRDGQGAIAATGTDGEGVSVGGEPEVNGTGDEPAPVARVAAPEVPQPAEEAGSADGGIDGVAAG
jgi:hypothetical protein